MLQFDCRNKSPDDAALAIVEHYSALSPGEPVTAILSEFPVHTRMWFMEAGIRHRAIRDDGSWRLSYVRGAAPALGTPTGFHHLVAGGDSVWACQRSPVTARVDCGTRGIAGVSSALARGSHLALDQVGDQIVVADPKAGQLVALRRSDLSLAHRWDTPGGPELPLVTSEGIVCVTGARTGTFTIIRPQRGAYTTQIVEVGPVPHDPALSSDEQYAFVPCMGSCELVKVRLSDGVVLGRCRVGDGPAHAKTDRARKRIYVANSWDGTVTAITEDGAAIATAASGLWAHALCLTPDGGQVWVANFMDDTVAVFDAGSLKRIAVLETEAYPHGLDISPDGRRAVVTGFASAHVRIYDIPSLTLKSRVEIGLGGSHTAFVDGGRLAMITCSVADHLACVELDSGTVLNRIAVRP